MAINNSAIATTDITEIDTVAIEIFETRPSTEYMNTPGTPNTLVGYYNPSRDIVELYMRDSSGYRFVKIS